LRAERAHPGYSGVSQHRKSSSSAAGREIHPDWEGMAAAAAAQGMERQMAGRAVALLACMALGACGSDYAGYAGSFVPPAPVGLTQPSWVVAGPTTIAFGGRQDQQERAVRVLLQSMRSQPASYRLAVERQAQVNDLPDPLRALLGAVAQGQGRIEYLPEAQAGAGQAKSLALLAVLAAPVLELLVEAAQRWVVEAMTGFPQYEARVYFDPADGGVTRINLEPMRAAPIRGGRPAAYGVAQR